MNNPEKIHNLEYNDDNLKYGLSPLHAGIKCLEFVLHISYKKKTLESNKIASIKQNNETVIQKKKIQNVKNWE